MPSRLRAHVRAWRIARTPAATLAAGLLLLGLGVPLVREPLLAVPHAVWLQVALLVAGCLALLAKERAPIAVLALSAALFLADLALGGSLGAVLVLFDAIASAVLCTSDRGRRALLAGVVAVAAGGTLLALVLTRDAREAALTALQLFAIVGLPYWWGLAVQRERARAAIEAARADDLERLAALTQHDAVREERGRMARDLHDAIASELSAIAIHSSAALASPTPRASLEAIRAASIRSLEQMRSMILVLRSGGDAATAPDRLSDASGVLARARERGLAVRLEGEVPTMPVAVDQAAGRILQEALTNALKHARGSDVAVEVAEHDDALSLRIVSGSLRRDAAAIEPVDAPPSAGLGLRLMRERAEALGGSLSAGPEGDAAWTVQAMLPLRA